VGDLPVLSLFRQYSYPEIDGRAALFSQVVILLAGLFWPGNPQTVPETQAALTTKYLHSICKTNSSEVMK